MKAELLCHLLAAVLIVLPGSMRPLPAAASDGPSPPSTLVPGSLERAVPVRGTCPQFRWVAPEADGEIELRVVPLGGWAGAAEAESLRLSAPVAGKARSQVLSGDRRAWQPEAEGCLDVGRRYSWFVRRLGPEGAGPWSPGRLFEVRAPVQPDLPTERVVATPESGMDETGRVADMAIGGTIQGGIYVDGWPVLTAGPHVLMIPAAAFTEYDNYGTNYVFDAGQYIRAVDSGGSGWLEWDYFYAPVYLPYGAAIKKLWAGFYDGDGGRDAWVSLVRQSASDGSFETLMSVSSSSQTTGTYKWEDSISFTHTVSDSSYYLLMLGMYKNTHRLYSVGIAYAVPAD